MSFHKYLQESYDNDIYTQKFIETFPNIFSILPDKKIGNKCIKNVLSKYYDNILISNISCYHMYNKNNKLILNIWLRYFRWNLNNTNNNLIEIGR